MRILIAYDGSADADAAIEDLRRAGLPRNTEAVVVSVAHHGWPEAKHTDTDKGPWKATVKEAEILAENGRARLQSIFPGWSVSVRRSGVTPQRRC